LLGVYGSGLIRLTEYERRAGGWSENNGRLGLGVGKEWALHVTVLEQKLNIPDDQLAQVLIIHPRILKNAKGYWLNR
jgi:hypothetical protein